MRVRNAKKAETDEHTDSFDSILALHRSTLNIPRELQEEWEGRGEHKRWAVGCRNLLKESRVGT